MGMLGSTPARMFMSSGGGGASGASGGALDGMKDSLLDKRLQDWSTARPQP